MAFVGRVGEPVGFDDGPDDDDRQRNPCQNAKQTKHKKKRKENKEMAPSVLLAHCNQAGQNDHQHTKYNEKEGNHLVITAKKTNKILYGISPRLCH